jgi:hypothetical protein
MANDLIDCIENKENKLEVFIPARVVVKKGIMRGIPLDISTEELLELEPRTHPSMSPGQRDYRC